MKKTEDFVDELYRLESITDPYQKIIVQERIDVLRTIISLRNSKYELLTSNDCDHSQHGLSNKPLLYSGYYVNYDHKSEIIYKLGCLVCGDWMLECPKSQVDLNNLIGFKGSLKDEYNDIYTVEKIKIISTDFHNLISNGCSCEEAISLLKAKYEINNLPQYDCNEERSLNEVIDSIIEVEYAESKSYLDYQLDKISYLKKALNSGEISDVEKELIVNKMNKLGIDIQSIELEFKRVFINNN